METLPSRIWPITQSLPDLAPASIASTSKPVGVRLTDTSSESDGIPAATRAERSFSLSGISVPVTDARSADSTVAWSRTVADDRVDDEFGLADGVGDAGEELPGPSAEAAPEATWLAPAWQAETVRRAARAAIHAETALARRPHFLTCRSSHITETFCHGSLGHPPAGSGCTVAAGRNATGVTLVLSSWRRSCKAAQAAALSVSGTCGSSSPVPGSTKTACPSSSSARTTSPS